MLRGGFITAHFIEACPTRRSFASVEPGGVRQLSLTNCLHLLALACIPRSCSRLLLEATGGKFGISHGQPIPMSRQHVFRKKPSVQQILHRLEGAAHQDALGASLSDVLQAHQFIA